MHLQPSGDSSAWMKEDLPALLGPITSVVNLSIDAHKLMVILEIRNFRFNVF